VNADAFLFHENNGRRAEAMRRNKGLAEEKALKKGMQKNPASSQRRCSELYAKA
jgi:hypothetical protein